MIPDYESFEIVTKGISDQQREFAVRHGLIGKEALPTETGEEKQR